MLLAIFSVVVLPIQISLDLSSRARTRESDFLLVPTSLPLASDNCYLMNSSFVEEGSLSRY